MDTQNTYGLWPMVFINSMIILFIVFSFFRPRTRRDWRTFGAFSAFVIALFTEMYGFPLTIYLFSGWLTSHFPEIDWLSHDSGHLLQRLIGWDGNPHFGPIHIISDIFIISGILLLASSWKILFNAQKNHNLADTGPYDHLRHPQYTAFTVIMIGFLIQWPTILTLAMFPMLIAIYIRLAIREEKEALEEFGEQYAHYAKKTPRFFPKLGKLIKHRRYLVSQSLKQEDRNENIPADEGKVWSKQT